MRHTRGAGVVAKEQQDEEKKVRLREEWQVKGEDYIEVLHGESSGASGNKRAYYRTKSKEWLLSSNGLLNSVIGAVWEHFWPPTVEVASGTSTAPDGGAPKVNASAASPVAAGKGVAVAAQSVQAGKRAAAKKAPSPATKMVATPMFSKATTTLKKKDEAKDKKKEMTETKPTCTKTLLHQEKWALLTKAADQGPDVVCSMMFLQRALYLNIEYIPDPSHGVWNDVKLAIAQVNMRWHLWLMISVLNTSHQTYQDWFTQLNEMVEDYFAVMTYKSCPLFLHYLPAILRDLDMEDRATEPGIAKEVWKMFKNAWYLFKRGDKVGLCRWFGALGCSRALDKVHHMRLVHLVYMGIMKGWIKKSFAGVVKKRVEGARKKMKIVAQREATEEKERMRDQAKDVESNGNCQNVLHLSAAVLSDPMCQVRQRVLLVCTEKSREWHSSQSKLLRSVLEACEWMKSQVYGQYMKALEDTFNVMEDQPALQFVGIATRRIPGLEKMFAKHPVILDQGEVSQLMGRFILALVGRRVVRALWLLKGWPAQSLWLCHKKEKKRTEAKDQLRRLVNLDKKMQQSTSPWAQKRVKRSIFRLACVQQIVEWLERDGWILSDKLVAFCETRYKGILQSKVIEDAIQRLRRAECLGMANSYANDRAFATLVDREILDAVHRYEVVNWRRQKVKRGKAGLLPCNAYQPRLVDDKIGLQRICSMDPKTAWFSTNAAGAPVVYSDLMVLDQLERMNLYDYGHLLWFSSLFRGPDLMVRRLEWNEEKRKYKAPKDAPWYFVLCEVAGGECAIAWRAKETNPGQEGHRASRSQMRGEYHGWYTPSASKDFECLIVTDPKVQWEACHYIWKAPVEQRVSELGGYVVDDGTCFSEKRTKLRAAMLKAPKPLLVLAAEECFWAIPLQALQKIATHYDASPPAGIKKTVFNVCYYLVAYVLKLDFEGKIDDEEKLLLILDKRKFRVSQEDKDNELAKALRELEDDVPDILPKEEVRTFAKEKKDNQAQIAEDEEFKMELGQRRKEWAEKKRTAGGRKRRKTSADMENEDSWPRGSIHDLPGKFSSEQVTALCPPGVMLYANETSKAWQVGYASAMVREKLSRYARSWIEHGYREGALQLLQLVWTEYLEPRPGKRCPIAGPMAFRPSNDAGDIDVPEDGEMHDDVGEGHLDLDALD